MLDKEVLEKIKNIIKKTNNQGSKYYKEIDGRNCYMHALKIDMNVNKIFPNTKDFEVGSISNTFSNIRTKDEIETSLYKDIELLDLNIEKLNDPSLKLLNEYEWKIALYIMQEPIKLKSGALRKCCHLIRQDYDNKRWTHKSGFSSSASTVNFNMLEHIKYHYNKN